MGVWGWLFAFWGPCLLALEVQSQQFEPSQYFIGQRVRLTLQVDEPIPKIDLEMNEKSDKRAASQYPDWLPSSLDYRIYSVKVESYMVIVNYAVFSTTIDTIAPFVFEGLAIPALSIPRARLSSDRAAKLPPLESRPLSLPWVDLSMALLIQLLVLLPILLFQSSRHIKSWVMRCYAGYLDKKPYRQLLRHLNILQHKENLEEYYRILSSQLRHYLAQRTCHPCSAYTTEELANLHIEGLPVSEGSGQKKLGGSIRIGEAGKVRDSAQLWPQVLALLRSGDDLRFRATPTNIALEVAQRTRETQTVIRFAKLIERLYQRGGRKRLHA